MRRHIPAFCLFILIALGGYVYSAVSLTDVNDGTVAQDMADADANFDTIEGYLDEIVAARNGEADLDTKIDDMVSDIDALTAGTVPDGTLTTAKFADDAVTYAKIQNIVNDDRILGRVSGADGAIEELTAAQVKGITGQADSQVNFLSNSRFTVNSRSTSENDGSEEVTNGGFGSDATGWTSSNCTLASVAGGQTGNCCQLTVSSGSTQDFYQSITTVVDRLYKISIYVKSGTSGNEEFSVTAYDNGFASILSRFDGTTSGSWVEHAVYFVAKSTTSIVYIAKNSATAGTMLFDTVSAIKQVTGYPAGDTYAPDGWDKKSSGGALQVVPAAVYAKYGGVITPTAANFYVRWQPVDVDQFTDRGDRNVAVGTYLKTSTASHERVFIYDDVTGYTYSGYHSGGGSPEWKETTAVIDASATVVAFGVITSQTSGEAKHDPLMGIFGTYIGEGNYVGPRETVVCDKQDAYLTDYSSASVSGGTSATLNIQAQTQGRVLQGVSAIDFYVSGSPSATTNGQRLIVQTDVTSAIKHIVFNAYGNNQETVSRVVLDSSGAIGLRTDSSVNWTGVSISPVSVHIGE